MVFLLIKASGAGESTATKAAVAGKCKEAKLKQTRELKELVAGKQIWWETTRTDGDGDWGQAGGQAAEEGGGGGEGTGHSTRQERPDGGAVPKEASRPDRLEMERVKTWVWSGACA